MPFYEESFEAIGQMEESLLRLDVGAPDPELINTIFRVAHSIKGGAAMFGFAEITSFTHTLETLLDELRGQRMKVTTALSDLLLPDSSSSERHSSTRRSARAIRASTNSPAP